MSSTDEMDHEVSETQLIDLEGLHLPEPEALPEGWTKHDLMREAGRFHSGDPSASSTIDSSLLPAVMHTLRRPSLIRTDYPLVLLPSGKVQTLVDFFVEIIADIDDSKVLTDNLVRVERQVRESLEKVADAAKVIGSAGSKVGDLLALNEEADLVFRTKGAELVQKIPEGTTLVPCSAIAGPTVALHLIDAESKNNSLNEDALRMRDALLGMLSNENDVDAPGINPTKMKEILGKTTSGSIPMDKSRIARIQKAVKTIEEWLKTNDHSIFIVRSDEAIEFEAPSSSKIIDAKHELCTVALNTFDELACSYASLFAAMRTARLELANAFESPRHDHLIDSFSPDCFSDAEHCLMPKVVAVGSVGDGLTNMASLSAILRSSRPITLLLLGDDLATLDHERIELAYLAVAHRKCFASQTSISHPSHMAECFYRGLDSVRPTIHTIASEDTHPLGAWLEGNAAIEGRACPLLRFDPSKGNSWADRFDLTDNPQLERDWPIWTGEIDGVDLELSFTFAHCAMLTTDLHSHFMQLPDGVESDDLIPIEMWLHLSPEDAATKIPYLWAADVDGAIHKLVVARTVTDVCIERLDYWRTLRELAGIDNEFVRRAVQEERELIDSQLETQRETLANQHASEIETIRTNASQVAMQQLAEVLLGGGAVNPRAASMVSPVAPTALSSNGTSATEEVAVVDEPDRDSEIASSVEDLGEPWIESPLCTTCNDCMDVNAQVFVYNEDKQAYIKDASAGTFAEIVLAAEACPARCIHPGSPLNPNEPNLDELVKRAAEFN